MLTPKTRQRQRAGTLVLAVLAAIGSAVAVTTHAAGGPPPKAPAPQAADNLVDPNAEPETASRQAKDAAPSFDRALMSQGQDAYKSYCQRCHGIDMVSPGGGFFDLRTFPASDKGRFVESVTHGKRAMPAWGGVLKPADIDALWSYIVGTQQAKRNGPT